MENTCIDCKHFHQLREKEKGIWYVKSCCTFNSDTADGYDAFVQVVKPENTCENFRKGADKWLTQI